MAEFCGECSFSHFGRDFGDFKGLCEVDECVEVICEGCGYILVDHRGINVLGGYSGKSKDT
jgi:hypothetical protein